MTSTVQEFSQKYTKTNFISQWLIDGFYNNLKKLFIQAGLSKGINPKILEVGCGPGFSTKEIVNFAPEGSFWASDFDSELVKFAAGQVSGVNFLVESIYELSHQDKSFDLVFCLEVLEHLEDPKKALEELVRVSSKYLIISVPNEPVWRFANMLRAKYLKNMGNTPGHINHWGETGMQKLLNGHGKIVAQRSPFPWQMYLVKID